MNYNAELGRGLPFYLGFGEHILPNAYNVLGPLGDKLNAQVSNPFFGQVPAGYRHGRTHDSVRPPFPIESPVARDLDRWRSIRQHQAPPVWGVSNYHAVYFQVEHRFAKGFTFLANYTISKLLQDTGGIDNGQPQGQGEQAQPQAGLGIGDVYGLAPSDITHKFQVNYSVDLPDRAGQAPSAERSGTLGQVRRRMATRRHHAVPLRTADFGLHAQRRGRRTGKPVVQHRARPQQPAGDHPGQALGMTTDGHAALLGSANFQPYINPKAFRLTQGWEIGNVPSTYPNWRGPGFSQWDLAMMKNVTLGESKRIQLRFEAQNLLNHMNAGQPGQRRQLAHLRADHKRSPACPAGDGRG